MQINKKYIKAIVIYIILFNLALFVSGFRFLIWESKIQLDIKNVTEESVVKGMSFIDTKPKIELICRYFSGLTVFKKIFIYKKNARSKLKSCPLIFRV